MRLNDREVELLRSFSKTFPTELTLAEVAGEIVLPEQHPLFHEISALAEGRVCSLPYYGRKEVDWVTFGVEADALRDSIDSLRAWLIPQYASESLHSVVAPHRATGALGSQILAVSPQGYFRWKCTRQSGSVVLKKLTQMRQLEKRRPPHHWRAAPSLLELRQRFQVSLATADWPGAEQAISQIDAYEYDSAVNTAQMRIRLWSAQSAHPAIVTFAEQKSLLKADLTEATRQSVLRAYAFLELAVLEQAGAIDAALAAYRQRLHHKLAESIVAVASASDIQLQRLAAYRAVADGDTQALASGQLTAEDGVIQFLRKQAAPPPPVPSPPPAHPAEFTDWPQLAMIVRAEDERYLQQFLETRCTLDQLVERGQAAACGEALLELFTGDISENRAIRRMRQQVLLKVIDTALCDPAFPQLELVDLYKDVLELWILERGSSNLTQDSQLVLSVAGALVGLSCQHETFVCDVIRRWWAGRPNRSRLSWLLEAVDLLSFHFTSPAGVDTLWLAGAEFIRRDPEHLPPGELKLWVRLGGRLGMSAEVIAQYLGPVPSAAAEIDVLATAGLRRVAIVTLQTRAGRMAADEISARTGAEVILVDSMVADGTTRAALDADVILFVWSATKHAVLRAFDSVKSKIEYVQGTGPASIVLAAERWVAQRPEANAQAGQ